MKKFLVGLGVVVALLVVAALVAPLLIPVDAYKRAVVAQIEAATGRKAQIAGDFHLSLLPNIEVEAGKSYWWCACGRSKTQPICDGSHKRL